MSDKIEKYKFAYLNSIAATLNRSKADTGASLERLVNAGCVRGVTFTQEVKSRGRRPKEVFLPQPRLSKHFDFSSLGLRGGYSMHLLLLLTAANFLARDCGAYIDACNKPEQTQTLVEWRLGIGPLMRSHSSGTMSTSGLSPDPLQSRLRHPHQ